MPELTAPRYCDVVSALRKAFIPVCELGTDSKVAIIPAAGRVVGLAFSREGSNLLWTNPKLNDSDLVRHHPEQLIGGIGGDRLWFSPELHYHWDGRPDWTNFANYKVPAAADPGNYAFTRQDSHSVTLRSQGELRARSGHYRVAFQVERTIRLIEPPLPRTDPLMNGVDYVGIESSHVLKLAERTRKGLVDLWHLLQVPAGALLVVPLKPGGQDGKATAVSYALSGAWIERPDRLLWRYSGGACAKLGLSSHLLTGRSAVLHLLQPDRWCMLLRDFPVDPFARYGDHPHSVPRTDQAFQAWDGFGFGEMEFHSRVLDAEQGPRELDESDCLWTFGGTAAAIVPLAQRILGVDISDVLEC